MAREVQTAELFTSLQIAARELCRGNNVLWLGLKMFDKPQESQELTWIQTAHRRLTRLGSTLSSSNT